MLVQFSIYIFYNYLKKSDYFYIQNVLLYQHPFTMHMVRNAELEHVCVIIGDANLFTKQI